MLLKTTALINGGGAFSVPADWDNGAPVSGDTVVFPLTLTTNNGNRNVDQDLAGSPQFDFVFNGSMAVNNKDVTVTGPNAVVSNQSSGIADFNVNIAISGVGATFAVNSATGRVDISDNVTGIGSVIAKIGSGRLKYDTISDVGPTTQVDEGVLDVRNNAGAIIVTGGRAEVAVGGSAGNISILGGVAHVDGTAGTIVLAGGILEGNGQVGDVVSTNSGSSVRPGDSPGLLHTGDFTLEASDTLDVEIVGNTPGVTYDQVDVTGAVTLNSPVLNPLLTFVPGVNATFTIIDNDGTDAVIGTFANLPEGTEFIIGPGNTEVRITYVGGTGNDVQLLVNGPPVAQDDVYSLPEFSNVNPIFVVPAPGVLENDSDPNGDKIVPILVTSPQHGTLALFDDGSFTYAPAAGFFGLDTFTYQVTDGSLFSNIATVSLFVNQSFDAPIANDDAYTVTGSIGGVPLTTIFAPPGVLANDVSPDGLPLVASIVANASHGVVTLNPDGGFSYTPEDGFVGIDTFTYQNTTVPVVLGDPALTSNIATVTLTVGVNNVAPVVVDDTFSTAEDKPIFVVAPGVLSNDTDANGDTLSAFVINNPVHGTLTLNGDGSFLYVPDPDFFGVDTFTYRATDGLLTSATDATVTINVSPVNDPPVATNDDYTATEDLPLDIAAPGVLANDTDIDGDPLTAVLVNGAQHGTVVLNADGSFTYTPNLNYTGPDSFTYRASDGQPGGLSNLATVSLTVTSVNDTPIAVDDAFQGTEDTDLAVAAPGVLQNDIDVDGDALSAVLIDGPTHGSLILNSDGSFVYSPFLNYNGPDQFTYRVSDGTTFGNIATVSLTIVGVNDPPVATNDFYVGFEDLGTFVLAPGVLANDTDADGDALTAVLVNGTQHGNVVLNADGSFSYFPNLNFSGTDTFTYRASDGQPGGLSNLATVTLTILPIVDVPIAVDDAYTLNEDTPLFVAAPGVQQNDFNPDNAVLQSEVIDAPQNGSVTLNSDGSFTYTPYLNFNGTDTFTYRLSEGGTFSNVATVTLTILPVNDAPVATDDHYIVDEDTPLGIVSPGVLVNDTDADGDALTAVLVNGPQHGTLTLNADGSFAYTPDPNFNGTDTFTYRASDGQAVNALSNLATVTITVTPVNDPPIAVNDAYTTNEDVTLFGAFLGVVQNDIDADNDPLIATIVDGPLHGHVTLNSDGSFSYVPDKDFNGTDTFTYNVSDGLAFSNVATVTITVLPVPDAPVAVPDSYSLLEDTTLSVPPPGVLINDLNPDGGSLLIIIVNGPLHGDIAISTDGSFSYTPDANYFGEDFFTYYLQQNTPGGLHSDTARVSLTIQPVNDAPVAVDDTGAATPNGSFTTAEDTVLTVPAPGVLQNDSDVDGDTLSAVLLVGPQHGTLVLNSNGSFTYTPFANYNGPDSFTYRASDGKLFSNVASVLLNVTPVPDAPIARDDAYSLIEDTTLNIAAPGVLINDSNPDNAPLLIIVVNGPLHASNFTINNDGSFTYTPAANFFGQDFFTYYLQEDIPGGLHSDVARVTLTVLPTNDVPVVADQAYTTNEGITLEVASPGVLFNATDADGDALSSFIVDGPFHGVVSLQTNGAFLYQPDQYYNGADTFTFRAWDGKAFSNLGTVSLTIRPVVNPPSAGDDNYTTEEDQRLVVGAPAGLLANDFDIDGRPLTVVLVSPPLHGVLQLGTDGTFVYTPNPEFRGTDIFYYRASDGVAQSNLATVTITVVPKRDTTVHLDPNSDTGESHTDRITNDNTPTFFGTTVINAKVVLFAQAAGSSAVTIVGATTSDSAGNYVVTSDPLADGQYRFFVEAFRADGLSTGRVDAGPLTIDTVAPRVNKAVLNPTTGQIYVTYGDDRVGMGQASIVDVANYSFTKRYTSNPRNEIITVSRALPPGGASGIATSAAPGTQTVVLRIRKGKALAHGQYLFRIISGGVADLAGNALDGEFTGTYPSGNGVAGGDFFGKFNNGGTFRRVALQFADFIPVLTKPADVPTGPAAVKAKAHKKG